MGRLVCDVCGGAIELHKEGKGKCSSCGIEYSKDLISEKIHVIKGVVETTFGETELNRLLKNVDTFESFGEYDKANLECNKIISSFPNDTRAYFLKLKYLFKKLNKSFSQKDYENKRHNVKNFIDVFGFSPFSTLSSFNTDTNSDANYEEILKIKKRLSVLDIEHCENALNYYWDNHNSQNKEYTLRTISELKNGKGRLFSDYLNKMNDYIPIGFHLYIEECRRNAIDFKKKIGSSSDYLKGLLSLKSFYNKLDVDGYYVPQNIDDILLIMPNEVVCTGSGTFCGQHFSVPAILIKLSNNTSINEAFNEIQRLCEDSKSKTQIFGGYLYKSDIIKKQLTKKSSGELYRIIHPLSDFCTSNTYQHNLKYQMFDLYGYNPNDRDFYLCLDNVSLRGTEENPNLCISVKYETFYRSKRKLSYDEWVKRKFGIKYTLSISKERIDVSIKFILRELGLCQHCGHKMRGVFGKTCTNCGKPKDY